jgi:hypothetical protein
MELLSQVAVLVGNTAAVSMQGYLNFGGLGDWQEVGVAFTAGVFQANDTISVIVSPVLREYQPNSLGPAPVCVATKVQPEGFVLRARNSSMTGGWVSFNWMATAERPTPPGVTVPPVNLRMGRTPPLPYYPNGNEGGFVGAGIDWQTQQVSFPNPLGGSPRVLLTGADPFGSLGATTWQAPRGFPPHLAACVGVVAEANASDTLMLLHNTDCAAGTCGTNYAAFSEDQELQVPDIWINAGVVSDDNSFSSDCTDGDWQLIPVTFPLPFGSPPVVLVTALGNPENDPSGEASTPAVVGLATYVTTDYFVLAARNSDSASGVANFSHVAIGCGLGCGQGRAS